MRAGFLKRHKLLFGVAVVCGIVALLVWYASRSDAGPTYESSAAIRGDLARIVSVTGRVEPASRVELAFETTGKVESVSFQEGDLVSQGETLAVLRGNVLGARQQEAIANLEREEAVLDELLAGTRSEVVDVAEASRARSDVEIDRAIKDLDAEISRTLILARDEIEEQVDQLFEGNPGSQKFGTTIQSGTTVYYISAPMLDRLRLSETRNNLDAHFDAWRLMSEVKEPSDPVLRAEATESYIEEIQAFLIDLANVVNDLTPSDTTQQTIYDNFKADISGVQSRMATYLADVRGTHEAYDLALAGGEIAAREFISTSAAPRSESVRVQEAKVAQARAQVSAIDAELGQTLLLAPMDGVIADVSVEPGEVITAGTVVIEMISDDAFELTANIPEADIADVALGNTAELTLDAFDRSRIFTATVVDIAPAEVILDGVPTYKTTLVFDEQSDDIRSGMTAELDILTRQVSNVVQIPGRSLLREGTRQYVRVVEGEEIIERTIETGLRGSNGMVEVIEGIAEGDEIVLFIDE